MDHPMGAGAEKVEDDHADPAVDYKFNPLVLAEIQIDTDTRHRCAQ
jgi:hypothetical protein